MRRIMLLLLALGAAILVGSAAGAAKPTWSLALKADPNPALISVWGVSEHWSAITATLATTGKDSVANRTVKMSFYDGPSCQGEPWAAATDPTDINGHVVHHIGTDTVGHLSVNAVASVGELKVPSSCLDVSFVKTLPVAPIPQSNSSFLCYSKYQTDPTSFDVKQVPDLMSQGYWAPWAVKGNLDGGTNVGDYHLVCNLTSGQAETGTYADNDGYAQPSMFSGVPGIYPVAG